MFVIDKKLQTDSFWVCDLELSTLLLMNDANYLWLILVPRKDNLIEIIDLDFVLQIQLLKEINIISNILKNRFKFDKINIANLGNVVNQLHIHIIGRMKNDISFPNPVWNQHPSVSYVEEERKKLIEEITKYIKNI